MTLERVALVTIGQDPKALPGGTWAQYSTPASASNLASSRASSRLMVSE